MAFEIIKLTYLLTYLLTRPADLHMDRQSILLLVSVSISEGVCYHTGSLWPSDGPAVHQDAVSRDWVSKCVLMYLYGVAGVL